MSRCGGVRVFCSEREDTYGFVPLHTVVPLAERAPVRSSRKSIFAPSWPGARGPTVGCWKRSPSRMTVFSSKRPSSK